MKSKRLIFATLVSVMAGGLAVRAADEIQIQAKAVWQETASQRDLRMQWFNQARFGLFIHWGLYSAAAGEWKGKRASGACQEWLMANEHIPVAEYEPLIKQFNPVKYNPDAWAKAAKNAGIKYVVITSKHHEGFCLWPTKLNSDWNIAATPYKKDLLRPLADACDSYGIRFCTYHSIMDWHHPIYEGKESAPGGPRSIDRYTNEYLLPQLEELVKNYHPGIMWFDGEWEGSWTAARGKLVEDRLRQLDPTIIINNRVGKSRGGMAGMDTTGEKACGDYGTPEQQIPPNGFGKGVYWESCMTMNNTWGYSKYDTEWKSSTLLIRNLIDCASKGGNYLLNVGPTAEGEIPAASLERLADIGKWMKVNGEAIYGTTATPFPKPFAWGRVTSKNDKLYLLVFDLPADRKLLLSGLKTTLRKAWLLTDLKKTPLALAPTEIGPVVTLPATAVLDPSATTIVVELNGQPEVDATVMSCIQPGADGALQLKAVDATVNGNTAKLEESHIGLWTVASDFVAWKAMVTKPGTYAVSLEYACLPTSENSEFEIAIGTAKIAGKIAATGGWRDFKTVNLGEITLDQPGIVEATVKATKKPGLAVMNLRSVRLTPK